MNKTAPWTACLGVSHAGEAHDSHDVVHALMQACFCEPRAIAQDRLELECLPGVQRGHEELLLGHIGAALAKALSQRRPIHPHLQCSSSVTLQRQRFPSRLEQKQLAHMLVR